MQEGIEDGVEYEVREAKVELVCIELGLKPRPEEVQLLGVGRWERATEGKG